MRAVIQRVSEASVVVADETVGAIGTGLLVYLGVVTGDAAADVDWIAVKIRRLRIFPDDRNLMNRDVGEAGGSVLLVSAFTTAADARKGRRPSFDAAAAADEAEPLYRAVADALRAGGLEVATGAFGAMMDVRSTNAGPVCVLIDSRRAF